MCGSLSLARACGDAASQWGWSKSKLGANAILGVSMAVCKAGAASKAMRIFFAICAIAIAGVVTAGETASEVECADEALPQIAFLILVHNEDTLGGAARLIDALYDRDHTFFVHFDTKMPRREVRLYKERHTAVPNRTPLV